jgi:hypothetical protein
MAGEVCFDSFLEFVHALGPEGLGADLRLLQNLCRDHPQVLDLLDQETRQGRGGQGGNQNASKERETNGNNVPIGSEPERDRRSRFLRQLRDNYPDLHAKVVAKELTVTEAALKAGIRHRQLSIRTDDPESAARSVVKNFDPKMARQLAETILRMLE